MSDNWMIVIPADPLAIPTEEQQQAAVELLGKLLPESVPLDLEVSDSPAFHDCGSNCETVYCPFCGAEIEDWWMEEMNRWWDRDRRSLGVVTPCCSRPTSLNDLDYVQPQGFACVAIELMNPKADLEPDEREQVETALGVPVRIIWRHI